MPLRLLGTVTNTNLPEPGGISPSCGHNSQLGAGDMATRLGDRGAAGGLIVLILDPRRGSGLWVSRRVCPGVCVYFTKMISWASWGRRTRMS